MKIRMDFVTNSSSSSFVAFGILSQELTDLIRKLVNGKEFAYSKWCVGEIETDTFNGMVTVVTTMDFYGNYYIYAVDEYDNRTDKQKEMDDKNVNKENIIIKIVNRFLPDLTAEETTKINQLVYDAVASGKTVATTYISETDGYSRPYFNVNDFLNMQDEKTAAKWLGKLLEKADAVYTEFTKRPQTLRRFAQSLNVSERTLVALIQKAYSKNAEEWLRENKYIIGKEEMLDMLLKQADENFEKSGKRPDSMRQFISENGSRKYISDLIMSVHNRQAEEWLIEKEYIVCDSDEEKLSEYLKRADDDYKVNGKRPENLTQFLKVVNGTVYTVPKLIRAVHNCSPEEWLKNNGYIVPMTGEDKLAEIAKANREAYKQRKNENKDLIAGSKFIEKIQISAYNFQLKEPEKASDQEVVSPTTKIAPNQPKEKMTPANDEATLQKYSDILESRKGTYPKDNISFEALKFFNKDIPWNTLNRITLNLFNEKIREYCVRMGFIN